MNYPRGDRDEDSFGQTRKRKPDAFREDGDGIDKRFKGEDGLGSVVAKHYNEIQEKGIEARADSQIYHMRNFNNWIKTMLINDAIQRLRQNAPNLELTILDMCCGKGGDMIKWLKANAAKHIVFADIADVSMQQCKERYTKVVEDKMRQPQQLRHRNEKPFTAEFITADCTKERLRDRYRNPEMLFDLVSIQFSFHYSFETLAQAKGMLRNVAENLRTGGYFIGTIPNAHRIVRQARTIGQPGQLGCSFGNPIYRVDFECVEPYPMFGAKYLFRLEDVVNCPEFLVHFGTLERLARRYGLRLVFQKTFDEYYHQKQNEGHFLLERMCALETYPAPAGHPLAFRDTAYEYSHAEQLYSDGQSGGRHFGTLAKSEWEAVTLYIAFMFQKVED